MPDIPNYISGEEGSPQRTYFDGPSEKIDGSQLRQRFFACRTPGGLIAGKDFNVMFVVDRPAKDVWRILKDFNLWQNSYGYFYSHIVGEMEGQTVFLTAKLGGRTVGPLPYKVLRAVPELLIVAYQPVPENGGNGGISPGFHVIMLSEFERKTTVTVMMEHATRSEGLDEEQALAASRAQAPESHRFWRDIFIPELIELIYAQT